MEQAKLRQFIAYQKSLQLFDFVVRDLDQWFSERRFEKLASQQLSSADSVCSNIEEGYGRESAAEFRRFLVIARGSARETQGRYERFGHWMPEQIVNERIELAEEVIRILSATINRLKTRAK